MARIYRKTTRRETKARVVVADRGQLVRRGLRDLIARNRRLDLIAAVSTGGELIDVCSERPIDIAIIGQTLPDMSVDSILYEVKDKQMPLRVIVYGDAIDEGYLKKISDSGAWACLSTMDDLSMLQRCIAEAASQSLKAQTGRRRPPPEQLLDDLTWRERQLLRALADGMTNREIAERYGISQNTVKFHLKNLYDKLGAANRAGAIALSYSVPVMKK